MTRVRQALCDSDFCRKLRGKIPKEAFTIPKDILAPRYPTTLMKEFPADNSAYSYLGIIAETSLQINDGCGDITEKELDNICLEICGNNISKKALGLDTTKRFIENINKTRRLLVEIEKENSREYNKRIGIEGCSIEGHPDIVSGNSIFEVKTTGQIKTSWSQFLLQAFCYAALCPSATMIYIVLPLSEHVWSWNVASNWPKRKLFLDVLKSYGAVDKDKPKENINFGAFLMQNFRIGTHIAKKPTLYSTVKNLPGGVPFQIFLSKSTKYNVKDEDIAQTLDIIAKKNIIMFVHSPYLLNLCANHDYIIDCLQQQLRVSGASGFQGVVVHVGKACKMPLEEALTNMRTNILKCLDAASKECPLLLETPAGQGTEVLTKIAEFAKFIESIEDERLGICVDTCHVYASGTSPSTYLEYILSQDSLRKRLKLVHFNDSKGKCASCVDRHAQLGCGWIGEAELQKCALLGQQYKIPMLVE